MGVPWDRGVLWDTGVLEHCDGAGLDESSRQLYVVVQGLAGVRGKWLQRGGEERWGCSKG